MAVALLLGAGQLTYMPVAGAATVNYDSDSTDDPLKGGDGSDNVLTISGGNFGSANNIIGGDGRGSDEWSMDDDEADTNNNTVTITGGTYEIVHDIYGGINQGKEASGNTVTLAGGTFNNSINIYGGQAGTGGTANNNTVTIKNVTFGPDGELGKVVGGDANSTTTGNTVNLLLNNLTIARLYGGTGATTSGNTLNIAAKGIVIGNEWTAAATILKQFQQINFYLPSGTANGDTLLEVKGKADLTGTSIGAAALNGGWVNLSVNDTVTLMSATDIIGINDGAIANSIGGNITFLSANSLAVDDQYTLTLNKANNKIVATVTDKTTTSGDDTPKPAPTPSTTPTPTPAPASSAGEADSGGESSGTTDISQNQRVKSTVETRMATLGLINSTADMLAGAGFDKASEAVQVAQEEADKEAEKAGKTGVRAEQAGTANYFVPYAVTSGSSLRQQSGSHVDTKGFGISLGFSRELTNRNGKLLLAPFVEYSRGKYDSYQDNGIHADGKSSAYGLGVMARQTNHDGLYYEGSLRFGRVKADYKSQLSPVAHVDYDSSSNYWAGHLGLGKITRLTQRNSLDCYLKYFYSHQTGDDVTININGGARTDNISFSAVNSHRVRVGARLTHQVNEKNSLYGGLAYQYEFGGDARATYRGQSAPSPSVKGGSGMLELGVNFKAGKNLTMDFALTGWAGKQRGVTAQLGMNWKL